jgi:hypothetical protein
LLLAIDCARPVPCGHAGRQRGLACPSSPHESLARRVANSLYSFRKIFQAEILTGGKKIQLEAAACPDPAARKVQPGLTALPLLRKVHLDPEQWSGGEMKLSKK